MQIKNITFCTNKELIDLLWKADPKIKSLLKDSQNLTDARENLFNYLNDLERHYFNIHSEKKFKEFHIIEKSNAKECIKVLKNLIRTENEQISGFSALQILYGLARDNHLEDRITEGFLAEFIFLFKGINAGSCITDDKFVLPSDSIKASQVRSAKLDEYADRMASFMKRYPDGNDPDMARLRRMTSWII